MFEPKTSADTRILLLEQLVVQMLSTFNPQQIQQIQQPYDSYMRGVLSAKSRLADGVLGPVKIDAADRADQAWILRQLTANLGRTVFENAFTGSSLEGAIGTKSFGQKYVPWLKDLPNLDESWAADMPTGFYGDHTRRQSAKDLPILYLIINTGEQLVAAMIHRGRLGTVQLYLNQLPENFNWVAAREEVFAYRGDLTKAQFIKGLADALISQKRPTVAVDDIAFVEALTGAEIDVVVVGLDTGADEPLSKEEVEIAQTELLAEVEESAVAEDNALRAMVDQLSGAVAAPVEGGEQPFEETAAQEQDAPQQ